MHYLYGDRIAKQGNILLGCSALLFDAARQAILLTRRADNGRWCLPGGAVEPGETVAEACAREVWEETGLRVHVVQLLGVYSNPHRLQRYADGNQHHLISLSFEVQRVGGELQLSDETTAYGYFALSALEALDVIDPHRERIQDALTHQGAAYVR